MASFIELIAKIKQKNNGTFKLVDAQDVECEDGKGLDEVLNEKLDKNQGIENAGKTMVVGADGNLVVGDSSPKNVYTKEEVDYLLDDKMDKPYVPIEITDSTTLNDCLAGNFKIDKIKGNTYQKVETDILPTPERPVPINSRKVKANGEYVELRSLKETSNLFDKNIMAFTSGTLKSNGTVDTSALYAVSGFVPVKPSTQYTIKVIDGFRGSTKVYYDINKQVISNEPTITFTTPSNCYFVRWQTATTDTRVLTEEDIQKINDEMMMVKGDSLPSSYVPPTVRDYKIVDHTTQTSKIVRNVGTKDFDGSEDEKWELVDFLENTIRFRIELSTAKNNSEGMCSNNTWVTSGVSLDKSVIGVSAGKIYYRLPKTVLNSLDLENFKMWLQQNPFTICYELLTQTEETITHVEADTSEVGYSWQDTTSPSPTIKSEVQGVEEIDILKTGKNLFDIDYVSNYENWTNPNTDGYFYIPIKVPKGKQLCLSNDKTIASGRGYYANFSPYKDKNVEDYYFFYHNTSGSAYGKFNMLTKDEVIYLRVSSIANNLSLFIEDFKHLQIEVGDTATAYEPYTEQRVNITPPQPMYGNYDGSICDIADFESGNYDYYMNEIVFDGSNDENWGLGSGIGKILNDTVRFVMSIIGAKPNLSGFTDTFKNFYGQNINNDVEGVYFETPYPDQYFRIRIKKDRLETIDVAGFKKWLKDNPIKLTYATNIKTSLPIPEEDLAKLKSLKTNAGVNNIFVGGEVKPTIEARYPRDLALVQQQLEQKVLLMSENLTATQAKLLLQGGN